MSYNAARVKLGAVTICQSTRPLATPNVFQNLSNTEQKTTSESRNTAEKLIVPLTGTLNGHGGRDRCTAHGYCCSWFCLSGALSIVEDGGVSDSCLRLFLSMRPSAVGVSVYRPKLSSNESLPAVHIVSALNYREKSRVI